jgi:hypothetical protein
MPIARHRPRFELLCHGLLKRGFSAFLDSGCAGTSTAGTYSIDADSVFNGSVA